MSEEVYRHMAAEEAVTDACEFLEIDRPRFFELALQWSQMGAELWERSSPEEFYTAWTGEVGRANLCANVIDQFARREIHAVLYQAFEQHGEWFYLDYGCGSGVVSFPFLNRCRSAVMVDVPNLPHEFVSWRVAKHKLTNTAVLTVDDAAALPEGSFDLIACIDVLEHLANSSEVFERLDALLRPGGYLLQRSPWAREDEDLGEHLPAARDDWFKPGGGQAQLDARYSVVVTVPFGALYHKQR